MTSVLYGLLISLFLLFPFGDQVIAVQTLDFLDLSEKNTKLLKYFTSNLKDISEFRALPMKFR